MKFIRVSLLIVALGAAGSCASPSRFVRVDSVTLEQRIRESQRYSASSGWHYAGDRNGERYFTEAAVFKRQFVRIPAGCVDLPGIQPFPFTRRPKRWKWVNPRTILFPPDSCAAAK